MAKLKSKKRLKARAKRELIAKRKSNERTWLNGFAWLSILWYISSILESVISFLSSNNLLVPDEFANDALIESALSLFRLLESGPIIIGQLIFSLLMIVGSIGLLKRSKWGLWIVRVMLFLALPCGLGLSSLYASFLLKGLAETGAPTSDIESLVFFFIIGALLMVGFIIAAIWYLSRPAVTEQFEEVAIPDSDNESLNAKAKN
jgi:hypothetical protein